MQQLCVDMLFVFIDHISAAANSAAIAMTLKLFANSRALPSPERAGGTDVVVVAITTELPVDN